ncbi:MAG: fumarylacetoacetate hydrolase family protein [Actinomycetota bacterium]|nr:fumarylacetoacetate hydrolase family protein [Actinomycetota bacterium]
MRRSVELAPTKIIGVHLSYPSRVDEYAARTPDVPSYFLKPPSSLARHGDEIVRPRGCRYLNYEGEVALVVGRRMKRVREDEALDYVAGYSVANDFGVHDFRHADRGSMLRVKGQDGFCPIGPEVVDAGDVDPTDLALRTYVNGDLVQVGNTRELLWPFAYMLADLSRLITLEPDDVLLTGTPANSRPVEPGDVVEVEVDGIGRLSNRVVEAKDDLSGVGAMPEDTPNARHVALAVPEEAA